MTDGYALLRAIEADPDEDTPRLAYADWLEEHATSDADRARAEFIRVQCELVREPTIRRRGELEAREASLRRKHLQAWLRRLPPLEGKFRFHRGFIIPLPLLAREFLNRGESILRVAPIHSISLRMPLADAVAMASSPLLARVRYLDLGMHEMRDAELAGLATSSHLGNVRWLGLHHSRFDVAGCQAIAAALLPSLRSLNLFGTPIGDGGLAALRRAAWFPQLEDLSIGHCSLSEAAVLDLLNDPNCARLRSLSE